MNIGNNIRIRKENEMSLVVETRYNRKKRTGEISTEWEIIGYYTNLKQALLSILYKKIFKEVTEEKDIKSLLNAIEKAENAIINAINISKLDKKGD